jgi:hypothetical protein
MQEASEVRAAKPVRAAQYVRMSTEHQQYSIESIARRTNCFAFHRPRAAAAGLGAGSAWRARRPRPTARRARRRQRPAHRPRRRLSRSGRRVVGGAERMGQNGSATRGPRRRWAMAPSGVPGCDHRQLCPAR